MSAMIQSTMIRASAGSGKTWQLANRYLGLMVLGAAPEKIIALTFTRKAAGEFTSRIMTRLAEGALDDEKASKLEGELRQIIYGDESIPALVSLGTDGQAVHLPKMDARYFGLMLERLVGVLDRLALSTLDSYFVRIVKNFALELGLSGFDLMEDAAISTERLGVMNRLFSSRETTVQERQAFLQSFKQATWGEEENRVSQILEDFVSKHQNRWVMAPEVEKWGHESQLWSESDGRSLLPEGGGYSDKAQRVSSLLEQIDNLHKGYGKSWIVACKWVENRVPGTVFDPPARIKEAMASMELLRNGRWVVVFSRREQIIEGRLADAIYEMVGAVVRDEVDMETKRTQGLYAVVSAYEKNYHENVRSRGKLCFSDLNMLLAGQGAMAIWDHEVKNLIDYRLDARYDHWLLDEFQDTSQPQWKAISSLVDEVLQDAEGGRSLFVVGDSKQSIYGWRGGEPRLFDDLQLYYEERLAEWKMDKSYRSSQYVLDLVNKIFDLSDTKWSDIFPAEALDRWSFHPHQPSGDQLGHSLVLETSIEAKASSAEKKEARNSLVKSLLEKIRPLENQRSCAILLTKNSQVTEMVEYLRREMPNLPVAPDLKTTLTDGPIGSAFLDLFRWLDHPSNDFARLHVSCSPLGGIIQELASTEASTEQWRWLTQDIAKYGIAPLVQTLIHRLHDKIDISEYGESRLEEILRISIDFSARGGSLSEWVVLLESHHMNETSREGMIQVMTVHKSKGLGFDVVILPELGGQGFSAKNKLKILERKGELGQVEFILKKPSQYICSAAQPLQGMVDSWESEQCYEKFCNLYVALTRAKSASYCILDPVADNWKVKQRYDDWIREATATDGAGELQLGETHFPVLFQSGQWLEENKESVKEADAEIPAIPLKLAKRRLARKVASAEKTSQIGSLIKNGKGMVFGDIVHRHFEQISWLDEMPDLDDYDAAKLVKECLEVPEIEALFVRPEGDFKLLREQPFETQVGGAWLSGVIDRAVITMENGQAVSIQIIDFKTDQKNAEALRAAYSGQLQVYREALARITELGEDCISCHLLSTHLKQVVDI